MRNILEIITTKIIIKPCEYHGRCVESNCNGKNTRCEEYITHEQFEESLKTFPERYRENMTP